MEKIKKSSKLRKGIGAVLAVILLCSVALTAAFFSDREQAELNLTASYPSYNVIYNANGGTFPGSTNNIVRYEDGVVIVGEYKEPTHINPGRFFGGWYTDTKCTAGKEFDPDKDTASLKADITVYAKWEVVKYTIRYNANGGTGSMNPSSHTYDEEKELSANEFSKTGYSFKGWATSADGSAVYSDKAKVKNLTTTDGAVIDLYAVWEVNEYTYNIVYETKSGIQLGTDTLTKDYGTTATVSPKSFTGYTSPASQSVKWDSTTPKTITFVYTPIEYTISYTLNGGTVSTANKTKYTIETDTFYLNNPVKTGYIFKGWTGSNGTTASTTVSIKKGSTGNKTFTANWTPVTYFVKYNANGGTGNMANSSHTYDTAKALTANTFTKTGYDFMGWSTTADGAVVYEDRASVKNLTTKHGDTINLYAVWEESLPILRMWYSNSTEDFHHSDYRSKIVTAEFVDAAVAPDNLAAGPWDVSHKKDGSVTAWLTTEDNGTTYHLTIAGNGYGKIFANEESSYAFYNFKGLKSITNTGLLETGGLKNSDGVTWRVNPVYNMSWMFARCSALTSIDVTGWDTSSVNDINSMFSDCSSLNNVEGIGNWNVEKVVNLGATFANCSNLISIDLSEWKTKSGENFNSTFSGCGKLTTIGNTTNWTTPKAENMSYMFYRCYDLTEVNTANWDVSNVVSMRSMFESCNELTSVGDTAKWCTDSLTTLCRTFFDCQELKSLNTSGWNIENVTTLESTFFACESLTELDVSKWDTSKVTTMESTFYNCSDLERLDVDPKEVTKADGTKYTTWDVSKVKSLRSTFLLCNSLKELDVSDWVTSSNTNISSTFGDCESLTVLDVSKWDTSKVTNASGTFADCEKLTTVGNLGNWNTSLIKTTEQMFSMCGKLQDVNISTWDMSSNTNNEHMFWYCDDLTELVIPASMHIFDEGFAALCQKLTSIKFNHSADDTITFAAPGYVDDNPGLNYYAESDEYGPFFAGDPYSPTNLLITDIKTENTAVIEYKWKEDNRGGLPILRSWTYDSTDDFHNDTYRSKITTAELVDSAAVPASPTAGPWDVSADQNGSVMAWLTLTTADDASTTNKDETAYHLTIAGNGYGKVFANTDSSYAFYDFYNLTTFNGMNLLDTRMTTNLEGMFMYCESLTNLDTSNWDTSNVTNMAALFYWCNDLVAIDVSKWNTEKVTDLSSTFYGCRTLSELRVKDWKTANVTSLEWTFAGCQELDVIDVSNWNTAKVTNMAGTFYDCWDIPSLNLKNWVVDNVTDMGLMFGTDFNSSLTSIGDVSGWNTSKVENFGLMFYDCYNLLSVDVSKWNTSSATNMDSMFRGCQKLKELDVSKWNVSKVTTMCEMFISCSGLTNIDISNWDCSSLDYTAYGNANSGMFAYCDSLTELTIPASMSQLSSQFAAYNEQLATIIFNHTDEDSLTLASAGYSGPFRVIDPYSSVSFMPTTVVTNNDTIKAIVEAYNWAGDWRDIGATTAALAYTLRDNSLVEEDDKISEENAEETAENVNEENTDSLISDESVQEDEALTEEDQVAPEKETDNTDSEVNAQPDSDISDTTQEETDNSNGTEESSEPDFMEGEVPAEDNELPSDDSDSENEIIVPESSDNENKPVEEDKNESEPDVTIAEENNSVDNEQVEEGIITEADSGIESIADDDSQLTSEITVEENSDIIEVRA